ncbi:MAG: hypothetical protein M0P59_09560 [Gallionella sp.]|jgi:hypothetical protein|nr:hypothetical protein [Gallionella sp.]MCK9354392.1 hypothetical protein [Gallionella sp.]
MARDKAKDDQLFNCNQDYELDQVASHYGLHKKQVLEFLKSSCASKLLSHTTHHEVYTLIKIEFGYPIPV